MVAYYNENDAYCAQWLRNLIAAGHIAPGDVDERSIEDVAPAELRGYTQCHFFAGIGVWSYALRQAGWPDDRQAWTGSCPCQPFSSAGKRGGTADERHLWPAWYHLIGECRPPVVFGEQVASKDGLGWLDLVHADLEAAGYARGAFDLCAAGIGAPHIRQRLYFVAERMADSERHTRGPGRATIECREGARAKATGAPDELGRRRDTGGLADSDLAGSQSGRERPASARQGSAFDAEGGVGGLGNAGSEGARRDAGAGAQEEGGAGLPAVGDASESSGAAGRPGPTNGFWRNPDWLFCRDGKWRPVSAGTFPLAHGATARVGRLRAYGNAIVAPLAAEFIASYMEDTCLANTERAP